MSKKLQLLIISLGVFIAAQALALGNWTIQDSTVTDLTDVYFVDPNIGWIFSDSDTILHTMDGGISWSIQSTGIDYAITDACFYNANVGWIVGDLGTILKTEDGGNTWTELNSNLFDLLTSIYFIDDQTGWVVGESGVVVKTTDGGETWTSQIFPTDETEHQVVRFADAQNGWVVGALDEAAHIMKTVDGGATWTTVMHDTTYGPMKAAEFMDVQVGWVGGMKGVILHTTDGGITWTTQYSAADGEQVRDLEFADAQLGWAVGYKNYMLFTEDGGVNWNTFSAPTKKKIKALSLLDAETGWAVSTAGGGGGKGDGGDGDGGGSEEATTMSYILKLLPGITTVDHQEATVSEYELYDNYPNPFNPSTTITYAIMGNYQSDVKLNIYNELGRQIRTLVNQMQTAGLYSVTWDGQNNSTQKVSSGLYFYTLQVGNFVQTKKMLLIY